MEPLNRRGAKQKKKKHVTSNRVCQKNYIYELRNYCAKNNCHEETQTDKVDISPDLTKELIKTFGELKCSKLKANDFAKRESKKLKKRANDSSFYGNLFMNVAFKQRSDTSIVNLQTDLANEFSPKCSMSEISFSGYAKSESVVGIGLFEANSTLKYDDNVSGRVLHKNHLTTVADVGCQANCGHFSFLKCSDSKATQANFFKIEIVPQSFTEIVKHSEKMKTNKGGYAEGTNMDQVTIRHSLALLTTPHNFFQSGMIGNGVFAVNSPHPIGTESKCKKSASLTNLNQGTQTDHRRSIIQKEKCFTVEGPNTRVNISRNLSYTRHNVGTQSENTVQTDESINADKDATKNIATASQDVDNQADKDSAQCSNRNVKQKTDKKYVVSRFIAPAIKTKNNKDNSTAVKPELHHRHGVLLDNSLPHKTKSVVPKQTTHDSGDIAVENASMARKQISQMCVTRKDNASSLSSNKPFHRSLKDSQKALSAIQIRNTSTGFVRASSNDTIRHNQALHNSKHSKDKNKFVGSEIAEINKRLVSPEGNNNSYLYIPLWKSIKQVFSYAFPSISEPPARRQTDLCYGESHVDAPEYLCSSNAKKSALQNEESKIRRSLSDVPSKPKLNTTIKERKHRHGKHSLDRISKRIYPSHDATINSLKQIDLAQKSQRLRREGTANTTRFSSPIFTKDTSNADTCVKIFVLNNEPRIGRRRERYKDRTSCPKGFYRQNVNSSNQTHNSKGSTTDQCGSCSAKCSNNSTRNGSKCPPSEKQKHVSKTKVPRKADSSQVRQSVSPVTSREAPIASTCIGKSEHSKPPSNNKRDRTNYT